MCLDHSDLTVSTIVTNEVREGYRVFVKNAGSFFTLYGDKPIPLGKWVKSDEARARPFHRHRDGFYGFTSRRGTTDWTSRPHVIVKVKFRRIVATGRSFGSRAFVAEEMLVPRSIKDERVRQ